MTTNKELESITLKLQNSIDFLEQSRADMDSLKAMDRVEFTGNECKAILQAVEAKPKVDWDSHREAFFKECVDRFGTDLKVNLAPHDMFEWFRKRAEAEGL